MQKGSARFNEVHAPAVAEGERLAALQRLLYARVGIAPSVPSKTHCVPILLVPIQPQGAPSLLMVRDSTAVVLVSKIRQGVDFEELSQLHSQDPVFWNATRIWATIVGVKRCPPIRL